MSVPYISITRDLVRPPGRRSLSQLVCDRLIPVGRASRKYTVLELDCYTKPQIVYLTCSPVMGGMQHRYYSDKG